jgi:hypothetical protein
LSDDRKQKTEGRRQMTDNRGRMTEGRGRKADYQSIRISEYQSTRQKTDNRRGTMDDLKDGREYGVGSKEKVVAGFSLRGFEIETNASL